MSDFFKIEKGVPAPKRIPPFELDKMQVGDSFKVNASTQRERTVIAQRLTRYKQRNPPKQFTMTTIDENTVRVFRVEDRK